MNTQHYDLVVIGGGYIGAELGGLLNALGSSVTLVAMENRLMERFDNMIGSVLEDALRHRGIHVHRQFTAARLSRESDGIRLTAEDGRSQTGFDTVIWAVGRRPNTEALNLEAAGIETQPGGMIPVDAYQNTRTPGVYAIGDITGRAPLTPVAIAAGRRLADRLFGNNPESKVDFSNVPTVVFSHPPIGTIGLTEAEARLRYPDGVRVYTGEFTPMRHALSAQGSTTAMKLVCVGPQENIAGIPIIGDSADERLRGFAVAVKVGWNGVKRVSSACSRLKPLLRMA